MKRIYSLLLLLAAPVAPISAQQPDELDSVLRAWEKATREVKSVRCVLERETVDKALQTKTTEKGLAMFLRAKGPDDLNHFRFELTSTADPKKSQKFIGGGKFLYNYEPANKVVRVFELAMFKKAVLDRIALLSLIFEMDLEQSKDRYQMELVSPAAPDKHYDFIRVTPKQGSDKWMLTEARISLSRANHLPAQIWNRQPNGTEITWSFTKMELDSEKVGPQLFDPQVPEGWRLEGVRPPR